MTEQSITTLAINKATLTPDAISDLLPNLKAKIEEIAIFKAREKIDPVIAVKVEEQWFSLFQWE